MTTLQDLKVYAVVVEGPRREELFDANRLVELELRCDFTFVVCDESQRLKYDNHMGRREARVKIPAQIRYAEPLGDKGRNFRVKIRMVLPMLEHHDDVTRVFGEEVITYLDYNTSNRQGRPHDRRFIEKCMRYHEPWDDNNPGGLWFTRHIALPIETPATT
jgi:hypothetical protein